MSKVEREVWRAVYTKPRSEKKIAERLTRLGLEVYCPVQTTLRQWSDRKKKVSVPVFPSYVFLRISNAEYDLVLQDQGVMNFVYWLGKPAVIRDKEMGDMRDFLEGNRNRSVEVVQFMQGEDVEIVEGAFKGQHGTIDEIKGGELSIALESLGMLVRVTVDPSKAISIN